jgi:hypothetical protein
MTLLILDVWMQEEMTGVMLGIFGVVGEGPRVLCNKAVHKLGLLDLLSPNAVR